MHLLMLNQFIAYIVSYSKLFVIYLKKEGHMNWKTAWSYLPLNYGTIIGTVENVTQRTFIWNNLNGEKIKVKFTNKYGKEPLVLNEVVVAQKKRNSPDIVSVTNLTFKGNKEILIEPGEEFYSDEIEFSISAGTDIVLSIFIKDRTGILQACSNWSAGNWHTEYAVGDNFTWEQNIEGVKSHQIYPFVDADVNKAEILVGISEIRLLTKEEVTTITLFGDSITHMSFYADALMEKLYKEYPGRVTILNKGIGGNKILSDASYVPEIPGHGVCSGIAAIDRFENDVFGTETPQYIFMLEGVNDLMHPYLLNRMDEMPTTEQLIWAFSKIIQLAHEKGSKIYLSTIMPLKHEGMPFGSLGEKIRNEVNEWILTQKESDGVFDFAKAISKEDDTESMKDGTHIGDGLHPNKEGGELMAQTVLKNIEVRGVE